MRFIFICVALIFLTCTASAQALSKTEQKILQQTAAELPAAIELLKQSVNINSGTFNTAGVKKVGALYSNELSAMGFTVQWINMPDSLKRAGHLVATRKGSKGKKIFLIGHLDTVFEPDMPSNPFTILNDSTASGQGVNDMKGGDVMIITALKSLYQLHLLDDVNITVYFTGDEENAGNPKAISRGDFIERAKQHDVALAFETATALNIVAAARRGSSSWQLEVNAKQAHSSGVFGAAGYGAVYEAARIVNSFREKLSAQPFLTFNPGLFIGGSDVSYHSGSQTAEVVGKTNIIAPSAVVIGDLRFLSEEQKAAARDTMRQIVLQHLAGTSANISFTDGIPAMPPTTGNLVLAKMVHDISVALGYGAVEPGNPGLRGAGDISYIANYLDCLDGLGASGRGAHAPGETINLKEYPKLIKRTALLIYRLTR